MKRKTRKRLRKDMNLLTRLVMLVIISAPVWALYYLKSAETMGAMAELLLIIALVFGFFYDVALFGARFGIAGFESC